MLKIIVALALAIVAYFICMEITQVITAHFDALGCAMNTSCNRADIK